MSSVTTQGVRRGFYAKFRNHIFRVNIGLDGQLWTWRTQEDVDAGRTTWTGQEVLSRSQQDAVDYCECNGVRNEETAEVLSYLRTRVKK